MTTAAVLLALLGPVVAGWLLVKRLWPEVQPGSRFGFGVAIGLALGILAALVSAIPAARDATFTEPNVALRRSTVERRMTFTREGTPTPTVPAEPPQTVPSNRPNQRR